MFLQWLVFTKAPWLSDCQLAASCVDIFSWSLIGNSLIQWVNMAWIYRSPKLIIHKLQDYRSVSVCGRDLCLTIWSADRGPITTLIIIPQPSGNHLIPIKAPGFCAFSI